MQTFLASIGVVAISEIGDKTQLLALMLAARFKRPIPIILGIFVATLFNHAIAGALGNLIATAIPPAVLQWILAALFVGMGLWTLKPDTLDDDEKTPDAATTWAVFTATTVAFFLAEIGDKTQFATAALAARFDSVVLVVMGTTVGMLIADVPAVYFGNFASKAAQAPWVRYVAALVFIGFGIWAALTALGIV
jgi:putative Ca2+/H+ antiporter (TMEM165/GDT1 family)